MGLRSRVSGKGERICIQGFPSTPFPHGRGYLRMQTRQCTRILISQDRAVSRTLSVYLQVVTSFDSEDRLPAASVDNRRAWLREKCRAAQFSHGTLYREQPIIKISYVTIDAARESKAMCVH